MKKSVMMLTLLLISVFAATAQTPKQSVAVYMAGAEPIAVKGSYKVLGTELAKALSESGKYTSVDRTSDAIKILAAADIFRQDGSVDRDKAKKVGTQLGAQYVCIGTITEVMKSHFLEARLVNVETAEVEKLATNLANVVNAFDVVRTARAVSANLVDGKTNMVMYTFREIHANPDKAIADYTKALRQEPNVDEYYLKRAAAYYDKKDYDKAFADFNETIRLNPNETLAYYGRGEIYFRKGDYDKAVEDYNQVIRLNPNEYEAYTNRGVVYASMGDVDRAFADYNQAIRLNPNYERAYNNRGNVYCIKKDYDKAIADYNQAIRLNPNDEAYYNRGNAYRYKEDDDKAIADYNQAIRLNSDFANAYNNRGNAYGKKGDFDKAIADYNQVIRLNPNSADAYAARGYTYYNTYYNKGSKSDLDKAIADSNQALRLNPNLTQVKELLEAARQERGR
jgi:tetratricopeptide (TPR) repeat protein